MTFIFTIDDHLLQVVSADFVPITPYYNESALIGIGMFPFIYRDVAQNCRGTAVVSITVIRITGSVDGSAL